MQSRQTDPQRSQNAKPIEDSWISQGFENLLQGRLFPPGSMIHASRPALLPMESGNALLGQHRCSGPIVDSCIITATSVQ